MERNSTHEAYVARNVVAVEFGDQGLAADCGAQVVNPQVERCDGTWAPEGDEDCLAASRIEQRRNGATVEHT